MMRLLCIALVLLVLLVAPWGSELFAQETAAQARAVIISIFNIAPGKHLDFLKWQAQQDAISKEAGIAPTQWYAHTDGASWDYLSIGPVTTPDQDKKVDALARQKGLPGGFKAGLTFRSFVNSHTDTFATGPVTASELVKSADE